VFSFLKLFTAVAAAENGDIACCGYFELSSLLNTRDFFTGSSYPFPIK
jgi:hypothetical protein